ncbi:MAG: putative Ig domain-containing protein [Tepidisphaeraceae bacterium]
MAESGILPAWAAFKDNGNGTATISGTPGAAAENTSSINTTFTTGNAASFTINTTGSPAEGLLESGALPAGISFVDNGNGTGLLYGTPAAGSAGTYALTLIAEIGGTTQATQQFTLTVT